MDLRLDRMRASDTSTPKNLCFSRLPTEINNLIFSQQGMSLVEYGTVLGTTGGAPLVTPDVEERLLGRAAEEVEHLDIYNDNQRARLSHILEATRAVVGRRSALPTAIGPDTDPNTLKELAAQLEIAFLKYASLSNSPTWAKLCIAALLGENTLVILLPSLSEGFVSSHICSMLQASAVVADFETFHAVATRYEISSADLQPRIKDDVLFSGNVDFVRKVVEFAPEFIQDCSVLETAIRLDHRSLFNYLYDETMKQKDQLETLGDGIARAFEALAGRGWEDEFKQLHQDHPQMLDMKKCLIAAAAKDRIEILKYLLFDNKPLAEEASPHIKIAFEAAVGFGNIDAINLLLGYVRGNPNTPDLFFAHPTSAMLRAVGESGRWNGIEHLMQLGQRGDVRFAQLLLGGTATDEVVAAYKHGALQVLEKLLQRSPKERFMVAVEEPHEIFQELLGLACECGHLLVAQELLRKDEDGDYVYRDIDPSAWNNQALVLACQDGHLLVVQELLRKDGNGNYVHQGVDPAADDNWALRLACTNGHLLVVQELLRKDGNGNYFYQGIDPAASDHQALKDACQNGHLLVVQELLRKDERGNYVHQGIDPAARNNEALQAACFNGHLLVVQELLRRDERGNYVYQGIDPAASDNQALRDACWNGHLLVVQELLRKDENGQYVHQGIDPAAGENEALREACENGHLLVVKELLRKDEDGHYVYQGIDPAVMDNYALRIACQEGHLPVVQELLRKDERGNYVHQGIDPAANDNEALRHACWNGHLPVVQELLRRDKNGTYVHQGIDPSAGNNEALKVACQNGHLPVVQELIKRENGHYVHRSIDPAARDNWALRKACENGQLLIVRELLYKDENGHYVHQGIDPAARTNEALRLACINGRLKVVEFLLQGRPNARGVIEYEHCGIDVVAQDNMALLEAIEAHHTNIVQFLLQKTNSGDYRFPGIAITDQMRQNAARTGNKKLQESLA